jgi:fructose-1,6-bisphosphatase/inositol monophosphatase family enzyme
VLHRLPRARDIDTVTALLNEAADTLILPRFRHLRPEDIEDKSTSADRQDLVTTVDRAVEAWLSEALARLEPRATVIGEEAVAASPHLLDRLLADEPVWLIDPIDGTRNFVRAHDAFGVMVARVEAGRTTAAWILLPARGEMFVAEAGSGARLNGTSARVPARPLAATLAGSIFTRYMPGEVRNAVSNWTAELERLPDSHCAAVEYTDTLKGHKDLLIYYRLLPWDHAAPALILTEAGGEVRHLDGSPYTVRSPNQVTLVGRCGAVVDEVRQWFGRHDAGGGRSF